MTETLLNDLSSNYEDTIYNLNNDQTNIPTVIVEPTTSSSSLVRKDSIVIPSLSNNSISSVIQIENNTNNNNNTLLPVCTSNSLGKKKQDFCFEVF